MATFIHMTLCLIVVFEIVFLSQELQLVSVARMRWIAGDSSDPCPPASMCHRLFARPASGDDDGFVESLPILLLANRIHRSKFRQ
jgi:hypothetical protein